jgi:hypothetical protein
VAGTNDLLQTPELDRPALGPRVPDGQSLVPGDLVLCGAAAIIDNVGL